MKIFFFDIDGTLAIKKHIPQNNKKMLQKLKEKGYLTFICSGRAPFYSKKLFGDLVSGYICCNGRYIIYQNQKLHGEKFSSEKLLSYLHEFDEAGLGALLVSDDVSMYYHLTEQEIADAKQDYGDDHIIPYQDNLPVYTFDIFYHQIEKRQPMMEMFHKRLIINDHRGLGHCDCSTIGYDKGDAIAFLLEYFHISKDDAYAFGDGYNDLSMFREVNHRIAMKNGVCELKNKATYVTDSVDQDGIKKELIYEKILKDEE